MFIRKTVKRYKDQTYTNYLLVRVGKHTSGSAAEDDLLVGRPVAGAPGEVAEFGEPD